ncbi:hypothetical protein [Rufibacter latericius]|uniref:Uncharacterized protein n=1 Tax=Rufibacter latericius TaxID=2487040 RepID=A0A3M9MAT9_9BACT|nr:hypothetical protein [Rufibacter latericius]RNI22689.1 hypothetical protein EFB08_21590 [Rufibacter latericius]
MINTQLVDSLLLVVTVLASLIFTYLVSRKRILDFRSKVLTFLMAFLAQYTLLNICAHLIAVTAVAMIKAKAGTFVYDMRFYTLIQFGVLLALINGYLVAGVKRVCLGKELVLSNMVKACLLQIFISVPLFPFNPLSLLPGVASIFLMVLLIITHRRKTFALPSESKEILPKLSITQLA